MKQRASFGKRIWERLRGFTLGEILTAVTVLIILALAATLFLNPGEILRRSRDSRRVLDMSNIKIMVSGIQGQFIGNASTSYVSIPDPNATSSQGSQCQSLGLPTLPSGWTYHCSGPNYYRNTDGTGWLPVDLASSPSGAALAGLPVDPANSAASGLYYAYSTDGSLNFELTSSMESSAYNKDGSEDRTSTDGGRYADLYETGPSIALAPADYAGGTGYTGRQTGGYTFGGFQPPIKTDGTGTYNLGRTLPVKFYLTDSNGNRVTSATAYFSASQIQNNIVGDTDINLATSTEDLDNLFRVSGDQYIYNLRTTELNAGTWRLTATLDTGASYSVLVSFRKF